MSKTLLRENWDPVIQILLVHMIAAMQVFYEAGWNDEGQT